MPQVRSRVAGYDLQVVQRAISLIEDLGADLDRRLEGEARATERLRLLRETTNRITRTANDAIQAYGRARRAVETELERSDGNADAALAMRARLRTARLELLRALRTASRRYPWAANLGAEPDGDARKRS